MVCYFHRLKASSDFKVFKMLFLKTPWAWVSEGEEECYMQDPLPVNMEFQSSYVERILQGVKPAILTGTP